MKKLSTWRSFALSVVADGLVTQGAKASAATVFTPFSRNIPVSAQEGLKLLVFDFQCVRMCVLHKGSQTPVNVCVSVNHGFVRAITHQTFKLDLDQRCKRPWLRSLLFCGAIDLDLQGQNELKSQNVPHFELVSLSAR